MTYIIAEIGQNHNGFVETAKALIDMCARPVKDYWDDADLPRVDAVKFCIRDLAAEMTPDEWDRPYDNEHSYGATYGEHREALELSPGELAELSAYAKRSAIGFGVTVCGPRKVLLAHSLDPDFMKVASRDLTNGPLLRAMSESRVPIILSTGMHAMPVVRWAVSEVERYGGEIGGILHCVSEYPTRYEHVGLGAIATLKDAFPEYRVGFSDHTIGLVAGPASITMGAEIVEKHVTLDKKAKGTDHAGAMDAEGLWRFTRDCRNAERMLIGGRAKVRQPTTDTARRKLERSICAARELPEGHRIAEADLTLLSPGDGVTWYRRHELVGRTLRHGIDRHRPIRLTDLVDDPGALAARSTG